MQRRTIIVCGLVVTSLAGAFALGTALQRQSGPRRAEPSALDAAASSSVAPPVLWQVPQFSFPDQHRKLTATSDLRGHVWIANFIFTHCTTICPLITAKMSLLQRRLPNPDLRFVSFSVDPAHDTPEVLGKYAAEWRAGESRWLLLSTTPPALASLASGMYVSVKPTDDDILHTNLFFVVDAHGGVRGIYESSKDDALESIVRDVKALSQGVATESAARDGAMPGALLYAALGCRACHARRELAPPLEGLIGRRIELAGGAPITADAAYIRESIVAPNAKLVLGYLTLMPNYEHELTRPELDRLVEHVGQLSPTTRASASALPVVTDPVCSMKVRVVETTPRTAHGGETHYFCSEACRDRFVADPEKYLKTAQR